MEVTVDEDIEGVGGPAEELRGEGESVAAGVLPAMEGQTGGGVGGEANPCPGGVEAIRGWRPDFDPALFGGFGGAGDVELGHLLIAGLVDEGAWGDEDFGVGATAGVVIPVDEAELPDERGGGGLAGGGTDGVDFAGGPGEGDGGEMLPTVNDDLETGRGGGDGDSRGYLAGELVSGGDIEGGEAGADAERDTQWDGLHGGPGLAGETAVSVVHDGAVIVRAEVDAIAQAGVILTPGDAVDVFVADADVAVTVEAGLGVPEAEGVAEFMDGGDGGAAISEIDELFAAGAADGAGAAFVDGADSHEGGLTGPFDEAERGGLLPLADSVNSALGVAHPRVDHIVDHRPRPTAVLVLDHNAAKQFAGGEGLGAGRLDFAERGEKDVAFDESPAVHDAILHGLTPPEAGMELSRGRLRQKGGGEKEEQCRAVHPFILWDGHDFFGEEMRGGPS